MLGWMSLVAVGCDNPGQTRAPGDAGAAGYEGPSEAGEPGAGKTADGKPVPSVRDRDPEQEKKKLALSHQRSAEARKALRAGRLDAAVAQAREALKVHEQNVDAMLVLAEVFFKQGKHELTLAVTGSALAVDEKIRTPQETSRAHNLRGFAHTSMGNDTAATQAFKKAAEADDKNAAAWNNMGTRYLDGGDAATALSCFQYALELQPRLPKAHLNLGAALRAQGKWVEAEKAFQRALALEPNYPEVLFNLGILYLDADPFPGLDTTKRLGRAIQFLSKYRQHAGSAPGTPGRDSSSKPGRTAKGKPDAGGPPVSRARADDYIRVAEKGLEREQRRLERERERGGTAKPGGSGQGASAAKPSEGKPPEGKPPQGKPPQAKPPQAKQPEAKPPEAKPPEAKPPPPTPAPQPPHQKPGVQKPGKKSANAWNPQGGADTKLGGPGTQGDDAAWEVSP
jgi:tetratricopeptide (TPR) repeat protein